MSENEPKVPHVPLWLSTALARCSTALAALTPDWLSVPPLNVTVAVVFLVGPVGETDTEPPVGPVMSFSSRTLSGVVLSAASAPMTAVCGPEVVPLAHVYGFEM